MRSFREFYIDYQAAHQSRQNRVLHTIGVILLLVFTLAAFVFSNVWLIAVGIFLAYLLPGIGHRHFEKNKSMRVSNPVYCVLGAGKMFFGQFGRKR